MTWRVEDTDKYWEYKVFYNESQLIPGYRRGGEENLASCIQDRLNILGAEGWELIQFSPFIVFKRKLLL